MLQSDFRRLGWLLKCVISRVFSLSLVVIIQFYLRSLVLLDSFQYVVDLLKLSTDGAKELLILFIITVYLEQIIVLQGMLNFSTINKLLPHFISELLQLQILCSLGSGKASLLFALLSLAFGFNFCLALFLLGISLALKCSSVLTLTLKNSFI